MKANFIVITFISISLCSCKNREMHAVEQFSKQDFDSVRYYKDVDYTTFEGMGQPDDKPFSNYPYTAFAYKNGSIDLFIFFSNDNQAKLHLSPFLNGMLHYSTKNFVDGEKIINYNIFDKESHKRIAFHGPIESTLNGDIREVQYYSKAGDRFLVDRFFGNFNSEKIPWQNIIKQDSSFLHENFCYHSNYVEEFAAKTFRIIASVEKYTCNTKDSITDNDSNRIMASEIKWPSLFYFMAFKGDGFESISN